VRRTVGLSLTVLAMDRRTDATAHRTMFERCSSRDARPGRRGRADIDLFGHSFDEIQRALGLFDDDGTTAKGHYCDDNRGLVIQAPREPQPAKRQVALTERKPRQLEPLRPRYITAAGVFNLTTRVPGRELSG